MREVPALLDGDTYIGREHRARTGRYLAASKWCNPFRVRECQDVHDSIRKFRTYLRSNRRLMDDVKSLGGKRLVCHCSTSAPCHADELIAAFAEAIVETGPRDVTLTLGIPFTQIAYMDEALKLDHPFDGHATGDH